MHPPSAPEPPPDPVALCARIVELETALVEQSRHTNALQQALAEQAVECQTLRAYLSSLAWTAVETDLGIWIFDVLTGTGWWSTQMYVLFGIDPRGGVPSTAAYLALIHPEDRALVVQAINDLTQGRPPALSDFRTNPEHGPVRILRSHYQVEYDSVGTPLKFVGTSLNVTAQRQNQAELWEQQDRYRLLFGTMAQGVVYQAADGSVIDANPAAQHILGLTLDQIQGRTSFDPRWRAVYADGSDFPGEAHPSMVALRTGKPVLGTRMGVDDARSQRRRWININAIPLFHPNAAAPYQVYTTFTDITARLEAETQLQQSEAQYRYVFEHNPHPMYAFDEASLRFLAVNDATVATYGYSRDEFLGMTILAIRPPEEHERLVEHLAMSRPVLNAAGIWRHQRKDGTRIDVEIITHTIDLFDRRARLVVALDITARLAAETALHQSEARFATIFARSPIALGIARLSDSKIMDVNTAFLALCGHVPEAVIGHTALELGIWARPEDWQYVLDQLQRQQRISSFQTVIYTAAREPRQVLLSGELVPINDEFHILIQLSDISALQQAQQELQELNSTLELRVQQRTAEVQELYAILRQTNAELVRAARAKDEFLANMSHELRTPINAILGYSENLQEQIYGPLNERQHGSIGHIEASARHLLTLINDILDLSKIEAGRLTFWFEPVSVQEVCQASFRFVREQALKKRLRLELELNDQKAVIQADLVRLKQILVNLLTNAVKFTPERGTVGLHVMVDAADGVVQFLVHDTGIGIAPQDLGRLFQPFSQIDSSLSRESEGTGLGLALVRRLAEAHGGSVTVASVPGQGSRFTVALPYHPLVAPAPTAPPEACPPAETVPPGAAAHGRILLADDNESNIIAIREYLHDRGYTVTNASDGYEVLTMVDNVHPDLILMDIQMPRFDGLATIRRLRALPAYATLPIIALTALAMPGDEARCLEAGATAYMSKPVSMRALGQMIQQLI